MNLNDYQTEAMKFRLPTAGVDYALFNLAGEVGELLSLEAKMLRDGVDELKPYTDHVTNVKKELGDILWHVAAIAKDYGFTLEEVAAANIEKLVSRKQRGVLQGSGDNR